MTAFEAFNVLEAAAGRLRLKDSGGYPLSDIGALAAISASNATVWDELEKRLVAREITYQEYADQGLALIDLFGRQRLFRNLDKRLADLSAIQRDRGIG